MPRIVKSSCRVQLAYGIKLTGGDQAKLRGYGRRLGDFHELRRLRLDDSRSLATKRWKDKAHGCQSHCGVNPKQPLVQQDGGNHVVELGRNRHVWLDNAALGIY